MFDFLPSQMGPHDARAAFKQAEQQNGVGCVVIVMESRVAFSKNLLCN